MSKSHMLALTIVSGFAIAACAAQVGSSPSGHPDPSWGSPLPWSRFARVETLPGMQAIAKLNDGNPDTCGIWCTGAEGGGEIAIRFPGPMEITQFRFLQQDGATKYRLTADVHGKGAFDTIIKEQTDAKPVVKQFIGISVHRKVHGLTLAFLEGAAGYRSVYEQSDRMIGVDDHYKLAYPCIISDPAFRNNWLELLSEAIEHGADGVYLMPDEYYYKGHNLSRASCPLCAAEFKKMYGYDSLPKGGGFTVAKVGGTSVINRGKVDDTEKYRKWKLFEYRKIADVFQSVSAELKRRYPKAQIVMSDNKITEDLGGRLEHNIALDIIENDPNADLSQVYGNAILDNVGSISAYARRIAAAAGPEKMLASIQWLNVQDWPVDYPIQLFGYAIPQIMLGAKAYENYRLNYMYDKGWWPNACWSATR